MLFLTQNRQIMYINIWKKEMIKCLWYVKKIIKKDKTIIQIKIARKITYVKWRNIIKLKSRYYQVTS